MSDKDNSTGAAGREAGGKKNAALTCRHFGMHRSQFYRRLARYDKTRLVSLEPGSTVSKRKREPEYSRALIAEVRGIRKDDPTYSGKKIRLILLMSPVPAPGRLISRENLFFRPDTKLHRKRSNAALKARERKRKPAGLKADGPNKVIEYDMKHVYFPGNKPCTYCAIDPCTKHAVLRIGTTASGLNSRTAPGEVVRRYGSDIVIAGDNGSENKGKAGAFPAEQDIIQYRATHSAPKEKPRI